MSAPQTHDPLVVNTKDGVVWQRRAVTAEGRGLYAVTGSCNCPEFLMATLAELAEHGIAGSAFALPMPVAPKPVSLSEQQIEALAAAGNRVVNDSVHERLCMCDTWPERCLSSGGYFMGLWDMSGLESALPAVIALWEQMRGAELERLRSRVAELEAERHSTNEALDDAVQALRARETASADPTVEFFRPGLTYERARWQFQCLAVAPAPSTADVVAVGFLFRELDGTSSVHRMREEDWAHGEWVAVESGGA
ncbi:hypothetical protein ACFU96_42595 [Streptomyces sp. NPDC057620]|uniref:hypothetical protein n=1 Tax=Streptomyces sp. NPDC057620 TaxID=3346185 RepID=UPI00367B7646